MHASDVAKLRLASSKKSSARDRSRSHASAAASSSSPHTTAANHEPVASVNSVLPHIAQIWPPNNSSSVVQHHAASSLQNGSDAGEMQAAASVISRSVPRIYH